MRSDLGSEHKLTQTLPRIEECLKTTPEGAVCLDRRSELLNEALAKEAERNVRRREEVGNTAGELAAGMSGDEVSQMDDEGKESDDEHIIGRATATREQWQ